MPGIRRRPVNTAVIVPMPSLIITSRLGTPLRGATITRLTSPPTRTGTRWGTRRAASRRGRGSGPAGGCDRARPRRRRVAGAATARHRINLSIGHRRPAAVRRSTDRRPSVPRRDERVGHARSGTDHTAVTAARAAAVPYPRTCEEFAGGPRGQQGQVVGQRRRSRVRQGHRPGFRKIAQEVRLPGFRAGKAPRRVLEARIGLARPASRRCGTRSRCTCKAVREHDVDLIASPEVEITERRRGGAGRVRRHL